LNHGSSFVPVNISPTCKHLWEFGLACKHNKNKKQYQSCTYVSNVWNAKSDSCRFSYTTGSLLENNLNNSFYVYPNPSSERFNIKFENPLNENIKVHITTTLGQILKIDNFAKFDFKNNEIYIDVKSLPSGMYFLKLELKGKEVSYPIYKLE
ncbi:MAG: T9SS type A sorting domain-containing protein, partial [Bacteroidia bacterium]|nr:T9SS type A sorting domain-containing protein [Bacteroidia bacterium]